jgi:hypothetical protein
LPDRADLVTVVLVSMASVVVYGIAVWRMSDVEAAWRGPWQFSPATRPAHRDRDLPMGTGEAVRRIFYPALRIRRPQRA